MGIVLELAQKLRRFRSSGRNFLMSQDLIQVDGTFLVLEEVCDN